ncbi:MAG: response regulator transcription factor [Clostridiales Family XIII bacterium]|jgi:DNA-binding response OmpR family regulator|nr:response regulator transcription factor [Clostridiales Family XIII bacterium]
MGHILIVEDDKDLSDITTIHLTGAGHTVRQAFLCGEALAFIDTDYFDCVLLDIMIPDGTGQEVCDYLRDRSACPIIFVSCLEDSATIVSSLGRGGDDYVTKPVNYEELIARVEANIRRYRESPGSHRRAEKIRRFESFTIDTLHRRVVSGEHELDLTQIEYALLEYLSAHADDLILYDDLYKNVWQSDSLGNYSALFVHVSNLKKKIDPDHLGVIENVRGVGYLFTDVRKEDTGKMRIYERRGRV